MWKALGRPIIVTESETKGERPMNLDELKAMYDFTGRTFIVTGGTGVLGGA